MTRRPLVALAVVLLGAAVAVLAAQAGPPGKWTRVTDPNGRNIDQVGLARTKDGVLHVFWVRHASNGSDLLRHTAITAAGRVRSSTPVLQPFRALGGPDAVVLPDGRLRVFYPADASGISAATGTAAGGGWRAEGRVSTSTSSSSSTGAAVTRDGDTIFAFAYSTTVAFHVGVDAGSGDTGLVKDNLCCGYEPNLATDAGSGQTWIAYFSNAKGRTGTWVQQVVPTVGKRLRVPGSVVGGKAVNPDQRTPIVGRIGASGLYVASCRGYPSCTKATLWRIGGRSLVVGGSRDVEDVHASAAPDGRVWVAWQDGTTDQVFAVRTNKAANRVGPVTTIAPPRSASNVWKVSGDGALGPLDLLVSATTGSSLATWHTQVLPPLELTVKPGKPASTIRVTDAGDPVAGAKVSVAGEELTTSAAGTVKAALPSVRITVKATKPGYAPATLAVRG